MDAIMKCYPWTLLIHCILSVCVTTGSTRWQLTPVFSFLRQHIASAYIIALNECTCPDIPQWELVTGTFVWPSPSLPLADWQ